MGEGGCRQSVSVAVCVVMYVESARLVDERNLKVVVALAELRMGKPQL